MLLLHLFQLWSSDSGHWSSADEYAASVSCSSSTSEVPYVAHTASIQETKSPEKRKYFEKCSPRSRLNPASSEKRRSYAEAVAGEWRCCESRPKRWSLAEAIPERSKSFDRSPSSGPSIHISEHF